MFKLDLEDSKADFVKQRSTSISTFSSNFDNSLSFQCNFILSSFDSLISSITSALSPMSASAKFSKSLMKPFWEKQARSIRMDLLEAHNSKASHDEIKRLLAERTQQLFLADKTIREEQLKVTALNARLKQSSERFAVEQDYEAKIAKLEMDHKVMLDQNNLDLQKAFKEVQQLKGKLVTVLTHGESSPAPPILNTATSHSGDLQSTPLNQTKGKLLALLAGFVNFL